MRSRPPNRDPRGRRHGRHRRVVWAIALAAWAIPAVPGPAAAQDDDGYPRVMQGPMIGAVTDTSITFWLRLSAEVPVRVELEEVEATLAGGGERSVGSEAADAGGSPEDAARADGLREDGLRDDGDRPAATRTRVDTARKADDYVLELTAGGLRPSTAYRYRVLIGGEEARYLEDLQPFTVSTAPPPGTPARFTVAIGSCARYQEDRVQLIWEQVERLRPDLFFWLGDNIYGDALDPEILAEEYRRQRDVAALQPVLHSIPQLATWDDHDFGLNDHDRRNPVKEEALGVFRRYWANPSSGLPDTPGVFFRYSYGGVDFFFLDIRYHRDPNAAPDTAGKTMLGAAQLAWLKEGLARSDAPFKVLISGSGWTKAKGPGGDSWASFLHERDSLFAYIQREEIGGVVLVSGDTHVGELNAIPWSDRGGYDFYDLVSSPLAQSASSSWLERRPEIRIRPVYSASPNVGLLTFDLTGERPTLRYELIGTDGRGVWEPFVITAAELRNGVRSWPDKITPTEMERLERMREGEGYYRAPGDP